jgi:hypothetical protein
MRLGPALLALLVLACADARREETDAARSDTDPQQEFWSNLLTLCDAAFAGRVIEAPAGDTTFAGKTLIMHVRLCSDEEIRIPLHVDDNRSRTWVLTRHELGLRLKHDHRHEDGTPAEVTDYGGDSRGEGEVTVQEFPADEYTATLLPEAASNVWTLELVPGQKFVYALRREGTDRRYRIEFDLTQLAATPPPPWSAAAR